MEFVDVFLMPDNNYKKFPAVLCSALTQTYPFIRMNLFIKYPDETLEKLLDKWWYTSEDHPRLSYQPYSSKKYPGIMFETCTRGLIIRNQEKQAPETLGLQWLFEVIHNDPLKLFQYIKFLEPNQIMTPECIDYMMKHMYKNVEGTTTPVIQSTESHIDKVQNNLKYTGIGNFMLKRETILKMIIEGFVWPNGFKQAQKSFIEHCSKYLFATTLPQDFLCISLKP